jgi:hypothetical protein
MNTISAQPNPEARWKTYLKAVAFLLPGFILWAFASVFFVPKLQQFWALGGGPGSDAHWVMDLVMFLVRDGRWVAFGVGILVLLCEIRPGRWARYRPLTLGSLVVLFNSAVLLGLWFMCLAALFIAPALMQAKPVGQ